MDSRQQEQKAVTGASGPGGASKVVAWIVLVALLPAAFLVQTVLDDGGTKAPTEAVTVRGWAYADGPLQNATLSIRTGDGEDAGSGVTTASGTFSADADLPADFRVTATGGRLGEQVFTGRLVADVVGYGPDAAVIHVNPVTTLLAAYEDLHADLSRRRATAAVRRFLQLPDGVDVAGDLRGNEQWFSPKLFFEQATAGGGVQAFVTTLVSEMDARPAKTHAFAGPAENPLPAIPITPTDAATFVAKQLATMGLNHALDAFGIGDPAHDEVVNLLHEIKAQLVVIEGKVDQALGLLNQAAYDQAARPAINFATDIERAYQRVEFYADTPVENRKPNDLADIRTLLDGLFTNNALVKLHDALMGVQGTTGVYKAWSDLLKSKNTFWSPTHSRQLQDHFDYFELVQVQLIFLLRERAAVRDTLDSFNGTDLASYNTQRQKQLDLRGTLRLAPTAIDVRTSLMWPTGDRILGQVTWPTGVSDKVGYANSSVCPREGCPSPWYGFNDWRLPTQAELSALIAGQAKPAEWLNSSNGWCEGLPTSCTPPPILSQCTATGGVVAGHCNIWTPTARPSGAMGWVAPAALNKQCPSTSFMKAHVALDVSINKAIDLCDGVAGIVWVTRAAKEKYWL